MAIAKVWGLKNIKLETKVRNVVDDMLNTCKYCPVFNFKKNVRKQFNIV